MRIYRLERLYKYFLKETEYEYMINLKGKFGKIKRLLID
jgi:hypothetical protein